MHKTEARKLWTRAFETEYSDVRAPLLRKVLRAQLKDVVALASEGRRRFDRDSAEIPGAYLFAESRRENTLFNVVQIRSDPRSKRARIGDIDTYRELTLAYIPFGMLFECYSMGGAWDPNGGKQKFKGYPGSGDYIPELAKAIPRLSHYKSWGFHVRCFWTREDVAIGFADWLSAIASPDPHVRRKTFSNLFFRAEVDLSDEAKAALRALAAPHLLDALASGDPIICGGAGEALRMLDVTGETAATVAGHVTHSANAKVRRVAIDQAIAMTDDPHAIVQFLKQGLVDKDRDVRRSASFELGSNERRLNSESIEELTEFVRERLEVEPDEGIQGQLCGWYMGHVSAAAELCRLAESGTVSALRRIAINRLSELKRKNPRIVRAIMANFDRFPIEVSDAMSKLKIYTPQAKAKMSKWFTDDDWAKRWRAIEYFADCPTVSRKISLQIQGSVNDEKFTVREAAVRAMQKLKRRGILRP